MLRQGNWGLKCAASQDRALKLYPDVSTLLLRSPPIRPSTPKFLLTTLPLQWPQHLGLPADWMSLSNNTVLKDEVFQTEHNPQMFH